MSSNQEGPLEKEGRKKVAGRKSDPGERATTAGNSSSDSAPVVQLDAIDIRLTCVCCTVCRADSLNLSALWCTDMGTARSAIRRLAHHLNPYWNMMVDPSFRLMA